MVFFSVVIPAHNEEHYIRKTLYAVEQQTYQDFEVIVVANGCSDATETLVHKRKRVQLVSLPEAQVSRARNAGAAIAQGNMLLFLDADTLLAPDALQKIRQTFVGNVRVATTQIATDSLKAAHRSVVWVKNTQLRTGLYKGCSGVLACRKVDFDAVGGYDDLEVREHRKLTLRLLELGAYACVPTTVISSSRRFKEWGVGKMAWYWARTLVKGKTDLENVVYERVR